MFKPDAATVPASKGNWLDFVERPQSNNSLDSINWDSPQSQGATGAFTVPTAPKAPPLVEEGPSEFTRLISVPSSNPQPTGTPAASPEASKPAQAEPVQKATSNLPIIIGINVVVIIAVALILYFVLRR